MARVCLQFVIVVFPDHTHLLFCWESESCLLCALHSLRDVRSCSFVSFQICKKYQLENKGWLLCVLPCLAGKARISLLVDLGDFFQI